MKALVYLFMSVLILSACKDPNLGPNEEEVQKEDTGYIQFESPAVGQKSSFQHFFAKGYYESNPSPLSYTRDTIHWEITKQINRATFEITERLSGDYFGNEANDKQLRIITLFKDSDKVLLVSESTTSSAMLGYNDTLELPLGNTNEVPYFMDWRIGDMSGSTAAYTGYVSGYKVKDKVYDKLDVYSDFTPTHYDGFGLLFAYNSGYGMVRHYAMNPWLGDANGFDLIRHNPKPNSLVGSEWKLRSVVYNDGSVKSIEEIYWGDKNIIKDPNFTLFIKTESEVFGHAGCNEYGGEYSLSNDTITIKNIFSTKALCTFTVEYLSILSESTSYSSNGESLIINSSYGDVKSLIFERKTDIVEEFPLENTKWILRNVYYPNGDIVPIDKILGTNGSNTAFNQFILDFKEDNFLNGFSGCNTYGGYYKIEHSKIEINAESITEMGCEFSADYDRILNNSTKFMADQQKLVIYSSLDAFKALEFERTR